MIYTFLSLDLMLQNYDIYDEKQIRIAFARGNEELLSSDNKDLSGRVLYAGVISDVETNNHHFEQTSSKEHYGNDFHIYTLTWKSNEITMEIDNVKYGTITDNLDEFNKFVSRKNKKNILKLSLNFIILIFLKVLYYFGRFCWRPL